MIPAAEYIKTGWMQFKQSRYPESYNEFDKATQLEKDNAEAWCGKGWALLKQNKPLESNTLPDSITAFDEATQQDPDYADAWCGKGRALFEQNKIFDSNIALKNAIQLDPNIVRKYVNEGWSLIIGFPPTMNSVKDDKDEVHCSYDSSIHYFENAIQIRPVDTDKQRDPDYVDAWCGKGWALLKLGKLPESNTAFDEAIILNPHIAGEWRTGGDYLSKKANASKEPEKSIQYSDRSILYQQIAIQIWRRPSSAP